jgi:type VI secretion system protein VasD
MNRITAIAAVGVLMLSSCASGPPPPAPPTSVKVHLQASADINPDGSGRASPLVVRVYELRQDVAFRDADFFALYDHEKQTLAADLLASQEYQLRPGESRDFDFKADPQMRFLMVAAAYRDLRNSQWRASFELPHPANKKAKKPPVIALDVNLTRANVSITPHP